MKRRPLKNQGLPAFLIFFAICNLFLGVISYVEAAASSSKVRRNHQKFSSSERVGSSEVLMINETSSRQEILVDVGETVYIGCPLNGTNEYECIWYKRGSRGGNVRRIAEFFDRYHKPTPCQFQIRSVTHDDEGTIICKVVAKSADPSFHMYQLTVTGQDDPLGNLLQKPWTNNSKAPVVYAEPAIAMTSFTEDPLYKKHKGENFQLKCEATGNPKPLVSWRRGSRNYTTPTEGYSSLKLTNLTTDDSGVYKCEAINIFGKVEHIITIDVKGEIHGASEIIDVTPRNVTLYEGNQGNITCIARFEGDPWFVWVKKIENRTPEINVFTYQGQYYSVLNRTEIRSLGQQLYSTTLLLQNVTVASSGVYHCIVAGLQGYNHSEAYLVVEKDPANLHIAQIRKHKTVAVLWILSFVIFAGLMFLCIFRLLGCPNYTDNKILSSQSSIPSDSSSSRKTQLPKKSPETLSTDCTNTRHEVFPLVANGSCSFTSQDPSFFCKECSSSCPTYNTYNSYDRDLSTRNSSGNTLYTTDNLEAVHSSCSNRKSDSLDSEFCSQQSVTSPKTETSDYYTTQIKINRYRNQRSHPRHHHKHCHQHHHLYHVSSENDKHQQGISLHPQLQAHSQCFCTQEHCSCHTPSLDDFNQSGSNIYLSSDYESDCYSDITKSSRHHHRCPVDGRHRHSYCLDSDGRYSRAVNNDRKKLNPSPNLSFYEQLRANPNTIMIL